MSDGKISEAVIIKTELARDALESMQDGKNNERIEHARRLRVSLPICYGNNQVLSDRLYLWALGQSDDCEDAAILLLYKIIEGNVIVPPADEFKMAMLLTAFDDEAEAGDCEDECGWGSYRKPCGPHPKWWCQEGEGVVTYRLWKTTLDKDFNVSWEWVFEDPKEEDEDADLTYDLIDLSDGEQNVNVCEVFDLDSEENIWESMLQSINGVQCWADIFDQPNTSLSRATRRWLSSDQHVTTIDLRAHHLQKRMAK